MPIGPRSVCFPHAVAAVDDVSETLAIQPRGADDPEQRPLEKGSHMSSLRGNNGPRYRHTADDTAPYETITIDKLTPIIGAEIGGVDLSAPF